MFDGKPSYSPYRALRLREPAMKGEDCYALQTACNPLLVDKIATDGWFGGKTKGALVIAQRKVGVGDDGICGPKTWAALAEAHAKHYTSAHKLPTGLLYGQIQHESSFLGGNYSAERPDHTFDAGVAQRNTRYTDPEQAFHHPGSIRALAERVRGYYDLFAGVKDQRRRWMLAQGAWNAPAFACYFAKHEGATKVGGSQTVKPSAEAAVLFAEYMSDVSVYLRL